MLSGEYIRNASENIAGSVQWRKMVTKLKCDNFSLYRCAHFLPSSLPVCECGFFFCIYSFVIVIPCSRLSVIWLVRYCESKKKTNHVTFILNDTFQ